MTLKLGAWIYTVSTYVIARIFFVEAELKLLYSLTERNKGMITGGLIWTTMRSSVG